jgi:hypothetical protein
MTQSVTHGIPATALRHPNAMLETPTFGIQAVHHTTNELQLVLKAKVDEVGIDKNSVWWNKGRIMGKEKRRSDWSSEQI